MRDRGFVMSYVDLQTIVRHTGSGANRALPRSFRRRGQILSFRPKRADAFSSRSLPVNASARAVEESLFDLSAVTRLACKRISLRQSRPKKTTRPTLSGRVVRALLRKTYRAIGR